MFAKGIAAYGPQHVERQDHVNDVGDERQTGNNGCYQFGFRHGRIKSVLLLIPRRHDERVQPILPLRPHLAAINEETNFIIVVCGVCFEPLRPERSWLRRPIQHQDATYNAGRETAQAQNGTLPPLQFRSAVSRF